MATPITLTPSSASLLVGQTLQLTATPSNGIKWRCVNCHVAYVSGTGLVAALAEGTAVITAQRGNQTASAVITVGAVIPPPPLIPPHAVLTITQHGQVSDPVLVSLAGTSDEDGVLQGGFVDWGDGSDPSIWTGAAPLSELEHTYSAVGIYTITLSVTDNDNLTTTTSSQVDIQPDDPDPPDPPPPVSPLAILTYVSGQLIGVPYVFDTTGTTDPDGTITNWQFTWGDGTVESGAGNPPLTLSHIYAVAGTYSANLRVTDNSTLVGEATRLAVLITPPPANQAPTAALGYVSGQVVNEPYTVSTAGTQDADGTIPLGVIAWGDGQTTAWTGPTNYSHVYTVAGTYTIRLTVTDDDGATGVATRDAIITSAPTNQPPNAVIAAVGAAIVGQAMQVSTDGTEDTDGTIILGQIAWGDGQTTQISGTPAATYTHVYATAGSKTIQFSVTDDNGASDTMSITVLVSAPSNLPPIAALALVFGSQVGSPFRISTSGTQDPDGSIAGGSIQWEAGQTPQTYVGQPLVNYDHTYSTTGSKVITHIVTDNQGAAATRTITVTVAAAPPPPSGNSPLARGEHPRFWLTPDDKTRIVANITPAGEMKTMFQQFVTAVDGASSTDTSSLNAFNHAYIYQLGTIAGITYGKTLTGYRDRAKTAFLASINGGAGTFSLYQTYAYDWLYHDLTATERAAAVAVLKKAEVSRTGENTTAGNPWYIREQYIMARAAFANDGIDDAAANQMLTNLQAILFTDSLSLHNVIGEDGCWGQGMTYSYHSPIGPVIAGCRLWESYRTMFGLTRAEVFGPSINKLYANYSRWFWSVYVLPYSELTGQAPLIPGGILRRLRRGLKADPGHRFYQEGGQATSATILAGLYKTMSPDYASFSDWLWRFRCGPSVMTGGLGRTNGACVITFYEPGITTKAPGPANIALTQYFRAQGMVTMRSKQEQTNSEACLDATSACFLGLTWYRGGGSYWESWSGDFNIDRKGPVVIPSGNSTHNDYSNKVVAFNSMGFIDPTVVNDPSDDRTNPPWHVASQKYGNIPVLSRGAQLQPGSAWDFGGIKRFVAGSGYDYAKAELQRAYYSTDVTKFSRTFIYLRQDVDGDPDRFIVWDRTIRPANMEARWYLHPAIEPVINGTPSAGPVRNGRAQGHVTYAGADLITATNTQQSSDNRMYWKPLLPSNRSVIKVGGPNSVGQYFTQDYDPIHPPYTPGDGSHEAEMANGYNVIKDGRNHIGTPVQQFEGTHRVEIVSPPGQTTVNWLNVFEVGPANLASMQTTETLSSATLTGARTGDWAVLFNPIEADLVTGTIAIPSGVVRVIICDLTPGASYSVTGAGTVVASAAGTIKVTGVSAGTFTVTKV